MFWEPNSGALQEQKVFLTTEILSVTMYMLQMCQGHKRNINARKIVKWCQVKAMMLNKDLYKLGIPMYIKAKKKILQKKKKKKERSLILK